MKGAELFNITLTNGLQDIQTVGLDFFILGFFKESSQRSIRVHSVLDSLARENRFQALLRVARSIGLLLLKTCGECRHDPSDLAGRQATSNVVGNIAIAAGVRSLIIPLHVDLGSTTRAVVGLDKISAVAHGCVVPFACLQCDVLVDGWIIL